MFLVGGPARGDTTGYAWWLASGVRH
eukprot:SAG31_NODE_38196_length_298_cov_0.773869_1_plen_25_part_10